MNLWKGSFLWYDMELLTMFVIVLAAIAGIKASKAPATVNA